MRRRMDGGIIHSELSPLERGMKIILTKYASGVPVSGTVGEPLGNFWET